MTRAYVIVDVDVTDPRSYEDYKRMSTAAVQQYGGRFLVRGGDTEILEDGGWQPHRLVVLEFDDEAAARLWYDSPEYTEARTVRQSASTSSLVLVAGA